MIQIIFKRLLIQNQMCRNINSLYHQVCSRNTHTTCTAKPRGVLTLVTQTMTPAVQSDVKQDESVCTGHCGWCGLWTLLTPAVLTTCVDFTNGTQPASSRQTCSFLYQGTPIDLTAVPSAHGPAYRVRHSWGRNRNGETT